MSDLTIRTNNHLYPILYWYELTAKEQARFDWLETEEKQSEATFIRYKGWTYSLDEFMRIENHSDPKFSSYDGYLSDTFFSGVLIKFSKDNEYAKMATFYS